MKNQTKAAILGLYFLSPAITTIAYAANEPNVETHDTREINLDGSSKKITRTPINDPFEMLDPKTGAPIAPDAEIKLPDGKIITAAEYYRILNGYQKTLNDDGISLKSQNENVGKISEVIVELGSLKTQGKKTKESVKDKDDKIMKKQPTPEELREELRAAAVDALYDEVAELYKKAIKTGTPLPMFNKIPPVQSIVLKPNNELRNLVQKEWNLKLEDAEAIGVAGKATMSAGINLSRIEGTVDANLTTKLLKRDFSLLRANAYGFRSLTEESNAKISLSVLSKEIYAKTWRDKHITISAPDTDVPRRQSVRATQDYRFTVGPVPMKATIGAAGVVGYDWTIGLVGDKGAANAIGFAEVDAFATCAATVEIAEVGIGGKLVLVQEVLNLAANMGLDFDQTSGKPTLTTEVKATNTLTMLAGELYAFVKAYVPTLSIPPFAKREWQFSFFNWEGVKLGDLTGPKVLWNFAKKVDENGYRLTGSPEKEDYDDVKADEELAKSLNESMTILNAPDNQYLEAVNGSIGRLQVVRNQLQTVIDTIGN